MSLMLGKLYTALRGAGASESDAEAAASEVAGYENRLGSIENRITKLEADLAVMKWLLGYLVAAVTAMLFKMFA